MLQLILAAAFFLGIHLGVSGTGLRFKLIESYGEKPYRIAFAIAASLGLIWLVYAWRGAPYLPLWGQPAIFRYLAVGLMPVAFYLVVVALTTKNPAMMGQENILDRENGGIGPLRITRHPLMWGIALWALLHLLANGDWAALVFFGSFLILTVKGTFDIDRKRLREYGESWQRYMEKTSNLPFQAIVQGRQKFDWRELSWWRIGVTLVVYGGLLHAHARLFGVSPLGF
ncbi:MAG: NnrU family protein [Methylohalobius sp. ZOD2]